MKGKGGGSKIGQGKLSDHKVDLFFLHAACSRLPSGIISLLSEELSLAVLLQQVFWQQL